MTLDEYSFPLQEKALSAFRTALKLALEYKAYNEWSSLSAAAISKLESEAYPITGQDGVAVEHRRTNFYMPSPITELDVVKTRVLKRRGAQKAAEEKKKKEQKVAPKPAGNVS